MERLAKFWYSLSLQGYQLLIHDHGLLHSFL